MMRARFHSPTPLKRMFAGGMRSYSPASVRFAVHARLGVRVIGVVENLVLAADGRARPLVELGVDEVLDAAVGALRDLEVDDELEVLVLIDRHDVAAGRRLAAARLGHGQHAVLDGPALLRKGLQPRAAPAGRGLAVPQELPAVLLLPLVSVLGCS